MGEQTVGTLHAHNEHQADCPHCDYLNRCVVDQQQEIADLRARLESIALVTAYTEPLPGSLVGHVKAIVDHLLQAEARAKRLEEALELPLMFHAGSPWTADKALRWMAITGTHEATTKVMCDAIRAALENPPSLTEERDA